MFKLSTWLALNPVLENLKKPNVIVIAQKGDLKE